MTTNRSWHDVERERRAQASARSSASQTPTKLAGYAALFNSPTTLYEDRANGVIVREVIRPGAFRNAIAEGQDVRLLFNHNRDYLLARTASGTLTLTEDSVGLRVRADLIDSQWNRDRIIGPSSRGDLNQMSFAFVPRPGGYTEKVEHDRTSHTTTYTYTLTDADLFDVSIVTIPAYEKARFSLRTASQERAHLLRMMDLDLRLAALELA